MTVSNTDSPVKIYTGTATEYPIPFDYISDNDILVTLYNTTTGAATDQTIDVDYTIVEETVTYSEEPGAEYNVVIRRVTECTQEASFGPGEAPPLSTHESAFDKLTMLAQDLDERLSRCVILPDSYSGEDFTLPDLTTNAGRLLRINEDGTGLDVLAVSDSGQATEVTEYVTTDELSQLHESGVVKADLVKLHAITSTHTEINQLHESGVVKADLEKLHDITASASEINTITTSMVGYFQRPVFAKNTGNSITIGPGVYHHSGTTDQAVYWSSTLTKSLTVTGTRWYYLYLSDSSIVTNGPEITADQIFEWPTAPTWSDAKHGWYNGNDRCIFAVHVTSGNVDSFYHDGGDFIEYANSVSSRGASGLANAEDVTLSMPSFSAKAMIVVSLTVCTNADGCDLYVSPSKTDTHHFLVGMGGKKIRCRGMVMTTSSQAVGVALSDYTGTNTFSMATQGYFFPAGM